MPNLAKLRRTPQMPCSVRKVVVYRMTATVNPYQMGVGNGRSIIKADLHRCTGGVAPCKVPNCRRLELLRIPYKFKSMAKSGCKDAEDTHKSLVVRRLELSQI